MRPHARQHLGLLDGFGEIVHPSHRKAMQLVGKIRQGGQKDNRNCARAVVRLQAPAGFEAVDPGQHHIEQDQIRHVMLDLLQRVFAILGHDDLKPGAEELVK